MKALAHLLVGCVLVFTSIAVLMYPPGSDLAALQAGMLWHAFRVDETIYPPGLRNIAAGCPGWVREDDCNFDELLKYAQAKTTPWYGATTVEYWNRDTYALVRELMFNGDERFGTKYMQNWWPPFISPKLSGDAEPYEVLDFLCTHFETIFKNQQGGGDSYMYHMNEFYGLLNNYKAILKRNTYEEYNRACMEWFESIKDKLRVPFVWEMTERGSHSIFTSKSKVIDALKTQKERGGILTRPPFQFWKSFDSQVGFDIGKFEARRRPFTKKVGELQLRMVLLKQSATAAAGTDLSSWERGRADKWMDWDTTNYRPTTHRGIVLNPGR